jgi:polyketide biosynthesis enoyl-CoA hydratase PksH
MVDECARVVAACERDCSVLVIEGLPEVFCVGADFQGVRDQARAGSPGDVDTADRLYALWQAIACGAFVSVAHVRGQANAGGVGFAAACDVVLANEAARFSLSEMLFGIYPACVLPFLIRRVGVQRANYMALTTQPIHAEAACQWGLVDAYHANSGVLLHRHLARLKHLSKESLRHYKHYLLQISGNPADARVLAVANNRAMHMLPGVVDGIARFVETGRLPWQLG